MNSILEKIKSAVISALPKAKKTTIWILKIIIPVSLFVNLLQYFGVIAVIAQFLTPVFSHIGLPGESAIVFITSIFLPLYAPIAIATTLSLGIREITILAVMCLISHNMIVETAIQKKVGSNYFVMFTVRLVSSFIAAFFLNKLLPFHMQGAMAAEKAIHFQSIWQMLSTWAVSTFWLILKIWLIIAGLIILQNILKEFNLLDKISGIFAPFMGVMGLSKESSFLWFVAHLLGLTYGSAVILNSVDTKEISLEDADLLNYHIAVNHSTLEDTLLFVAIGVPAGWMIFPRFVLAIFIVWMVRLVHFLFKKRKEVVYIQNR
ncbi:conserved membrane hypothetical protein [uncultured Paludibacter sp.]|uniref:Nucleoside transporter/FeoB GTPase Gate domain-containing protein n=1 Tax=uncultured Paludibacter sp. TaxID=497635 RepID=A0A653AJ03_9BACT|nr:conserved membrane hypothetical protein [uncultured Paludibacter sp.]